MARICLECCNKQLVAKGEKPRDKQYTLCKTDVCEYCKKVKPCLIDYQEEESNSLIRFIRICYYKLNNR